MKKITLNLIILFLLTSAARYPKFETIFQQPTSQAESELDEGIIDVLAHAATFPGAPTSQELVSEMDHWGVQLILISPYPEPVLYFGENRSGTNTDELATYFSAYPDRFPIVYGGAELNPLLHGAGRSTPFTQENICPNGCSWATERILSEMQAIADDPATYEAEFKLLAEDAASSGQYVAFGEISPIHYSLREEHPDIEFPANHPWMLWLADLAAQYDMPILLHLEATQKSLGELASLLEHNREAKIVWVHAGWSNTGKATGTVLGQMLSDHPNLSLSLKFRNAHTPERQAANPWDESGTLKSDWIDLFQNYPDRLMVGSDPHFGSRDNEFRKLERVQKLLDMLAPEIAHQIAFANALELFRLDDFLESVSQLESQPSTHHLKSEDAMAIPDCPTDISEPLFDHSPLAMEDFNGIVPLGNLNPPSHTFPTNHMYFQLRRSDPNNDFSPTAEVPVYSPGHIWLTGVSTSEHLSAQPPYIDYSLHFSPCRQFQGYFIHVQSLTEDLLDQIGEFNERWCDTYETGGQTYRHCDKRELMIELKSGEIIGSTGGREGQSALDLGAYDKRVPPLEYANPHVYGSHQDEFGFLQIVCAIDYFYVDLRDELLYRFGGWGNNPRTIEPICGQVEQDEPGTAQGKWYLRGAAVPYPEDPHIALVHDNVDPLIGAFSIGNGLPTLASGVYYFSPQYEGYTNRDFSQVESDGNIYCYDSLTGRGSNPSETLANIILVQLTNESTMHIEAQNRPSCLEEPWEFTEAVSVYDR